jgi:hypothetical protein
MRGPVRRLLTVAIVWLTMCATLFASSPHFECVRPDGSRSPFCLSWIVGPIACCTNSVSTAGETPSGRCSHCRTVKVSLNFDSAAHLKNSSGRAGISKTACEKAIVYSVAILDQGERSFDIGNSPLRVLPSDIQAVATPPLDTDLPPASISLPPVDIVVLNQHFLI